LHSIIGRLCLAAQFGDFHADQLQPFLIFHNACQFGFEVTIPGSGSESRVRFEAEKRNQRFCLSAAGKKSSSRFAASTIRHWSQPQ
jgi:hypothetical protein